jgi:hypothetical protein
MHALNIIIGRLIILKREKVPDDLLRERFIDCIMSTEVFTVKPEERMGGDFFILPCEVC